jgi:type III pantothenate kinase
MILCLDVGNSHIYGGVYDGETILLRFRHETHRRSTSDQLGVFLKAVLRENNNLNAEDITAIGISSVVPSIDYSLGSACIKYFNREPFWLRPGVKTGLKLKIKHVNEVGSDLIATAIAGLQQVPNRNLIIADLGTVNTFVAINKDKEFLGCVFNPGMRTSMRALDSATDQLHEVQIVTPTHVLGRDTTSAVQAGLYFGQIGAFKEIIAGITQEVFAEDGPFVIGTGGFAHLLENEKIFHKIMPDLVLSGIKLALEMNR